MNRTCETCRWWLTVYDGEDEAREHEGDCRRFPPPHKQPDPNDDSCGDFFVQTMAEDFCGEWKTKPKAKK